jgi:hypothetical protein
MQSPKEAFPTLTQQMPVEEIIPETTCHTATPRKLAHNKDSWQCTPMPFTTTRIKGSVADSFSTVLGQQQNSIANSFS